METTVRPAMRMRGLLTGKMATFVMGGAVLLAAVGVEAGGTIGWADGASEFAAEGVVVGQVLVTLGIVVMGIILALALPALMGTIATATLGFALMANAEEVASLFNGGTGGGSVLDTAYAVPALHSPVEVAFRAVLAAFAL